MFSSARSGGHLCIGQAKRGDGGTSGQSVYHIDGWFTGVFFEESPIFLRVAKTWQHVNYPCIFLKGTLLTFSDPLQQYLAGPTYIRRY